MRVVEVDALMKPEKIQECSCCYLAWLVDRDGKSVESGPIFDGARNTERELLQTKEARHINDADTN
jgi:hypothetical protein